MEAAAIDGTSRWQVFWQRGFGCYSMRAEMLPVLLAETLVTDFSSAHS
jgi:ABC-type sugar transport system permease subunit